MHQSPPAQRGCGRCERPAVYRVALIDPSDKPSIMLARRSHYRCAGCFRSSVTPRALLELARNGQQLVIDPAFTASHSVAVSS